MIRLLGNRVLIRREEPDEYSGSVYLPPTARDAPQRGVIVSVGSGVVEDLREGDVVLYSKYAVPAVVREDGGTSWRTEDDRLLVEVDRILVCLR